MVKIKVISPVFSQVIEGREIVTKLLSYQYEYWVQGRFKRERKIKIASFVKNKIFFTGFIYRISDYCKKVNIPLVIESKIRKIEPTELIPKVNKIEFRPEQLKLIKSALEYERGIIKAPTGIGKTVLAMGIMSCFKNSNILFLCDEKTLLRQTVEELRDKGFNDVSIYGDSIKEPFKRIVVSLSQSLVKLDLEKYRNYFDIIIVDECDKGMKIGGRYYNILKNLSAPIRYGLSATFPTQEISKLVLEGLIGPVIGEMKINEGIEVGLLAKPKLKFIKVPFDSKIRELRSYKEVYQKGIIENRSRNRLILKEIKLHLKEKKSVLVLTSSQVSHGQNILNLAKSIYNMDIPFMCGDVKSDERVLTKNLLQDKEIKCVIANVVWMRGINIPSLDVIIIASGDKSDSVVLQKIGRGMRTTNEKKDFLIVDFLDLSHPYLVSHVAERLSLYSELNWL